MQKIHQLFKKAMCDYGVKVKDLADLSGISAHHLTQFRQGNNWVSEEILMKLIENMDVLSPGSKRYFCDLIVEASASKPDNKELLIALIKNASNEEIQAALLAIGDKWQDQISNKNVKAEVFTA